MTTPSVATSESQLVLKGKFRRENPLHTSVFLLFLPSALSGTVSCVRIFNGAVKEKRTSRLLRAHKFTSLAIMFQWLSYVVFTLFPSLRNVYIENLFLI